MRSTLRLIPADGFYEPKGPKTQKNRPWFYFQMRDQSPFAFGSLWERWNSPDGPRNTFTILTTVPNRFVGKIHERQPVIIDSNAYARWLEQKTPTDEVTEMLKAVGDDQPPSDPERGHSERCLGLGTAEDCGLESNAPISKLSIRET
jgi:putative SOS response-associated peptidase YedK